jgi:hypothetical protein
MAASLKFFPGSVIRWHTRRYVVIDYVGLEVIIAREPGKRKLERIGEHSNPGGKKRIRPGHLGYG